MNISLIETTESKTIATYKKETGKLAYIYANDGINTSTQTKKMRMDDIANKIENYMTISKGRILQHHIETLCTALKTDTEPSNPIVKKMYDDIKNTKGDKSITIRNNSVYPSFDKDEERKVFYIAGMSGCGKSVITGHLIENYHKLFPKNKVILFSNKPTDPALDKHSYLIRIALDDSLINDQFSLDDLKDTLVIYDDIEATKSKNINLELERLSELILQQGRSYHTSFIFISHLLNNSKKTRIILNECQSAIVFPRLTTAYSLKYLLEKYFGYSKNDISKLRNLNSRWACLNKLPPSIVYSGGAYVVD